jgi:hypothetical protein
MGRPLLPNSLGCGSGNAINLTVVPFDEADR